MRVKNRTAQLNIVGRGLKGNSMSSVALGPRTTVKKGIKGSLAFTCVCDTRQELGLGDPSCPIFLSAMLSFYNCSCIV